MKGLLLRLPENIIQELQVIKRDERRSMAAIIREAVTKYLNERRRRDALDWFISTYCSKCEKDCIIGSLEMLKCMMKKINEIKKGGGNDAYGRKS